MPSATSTTTFTFPSRSTTPKLRPKSSSRALRRSHNIVSTPNLKSAYTTHSRGAPPLPPLPRKASLAQLTQSSLASIPDVSESYAVNTVLSDSSVNMMPPTTPGRSQSANVSLGDIVDVPGGMYGVVRFVGPVQGKKGVFAGVELDEEFANRGKNDGDVDGVSYFQTDIPGAGIFLPAAKALPRSSEPIPSFPITPSASTYGGLRAGNQNSLNCTSPTPSLPKFSASVGPGARAPSPQGKRTRASLPRPESPVRRMQMTPGPRPSMTTPGRTPSRYGSPTQNRFAQSVRGTSGDPSKRPNRLDRKPSLAPRSASAMGPISGIEEDVPPMGLQRTGTNGSAGSVSSFAMKVRPASRMNMNDEEIERLRQQIEDRDRQLREQSATLADMESSLVELQSLMESADMPDAQRNSWDNKDTAQLRQLLREKNDKIAMLTAEFDAHRADFRSTIDTLELASTETERVYEKRIEELMADVRELESRNLDVDSVATQLKQLEELVQELEEGLEDARRGEAEARGEVEFLRGEVERTRTELRREREKASTPPANGDSTVSSKELEQKDDEIRGLKAIIHSLSRDSVPGEPRPPQQRPGSMIAEDVVAIKIARDNLERQVAELQSILEKKNSREDELEKEVESLRQNGATANRSSFRDSRDTVVMAQALENRPVENIKRFSAPTHKRVSTLDTMPESDDYSNATETSTLWCEICETNGHDILTCTNMFGPDGAKSNGENKTVKKDINNGFIPYTPPPTGEDAPAPLTTSGPKKDDPPSPAVKIMPNPMESGPVAGKESGVMDPDKWCALCERDGHDSVDCPFEDAF
ncbi:tip elongation protein 1 [Fusarium sporotrichioides]|uniref:Tip elongation protein 1 n=1 Tax=Fusarium sporotrichioides TaxID=5514 RepID=A0A395RPQ1_FUSSP|nr:tip elongation protein 1 [Fusarium sporotrichioides]